MLYFLILKKCASTAKKTKHDLASKFNDSEPVVYKTKNTTQEKQHQDRDSNHFISYCLEMTLDHTVSLQ